MDRAARGRFCAFSARRGSCAASRFRRDRLAALGCAAGWPALGPGTARVLPASCADGLKILRQTALADQDMVTSGTADPVCHCCGKPIPEGNSSGPGRWPACPAQTRPAARPQPRSAARRGAYYEPG
jgi:hypothetical protein